MIQQPRLPYVRFVTTVDESVDQDGHPVYANKYWAHITPAGGKDEVVKDAIEWVNELRRKGEQRGPFDAAANEYERWHEVFSKAFEKFKAGEEMTYDGTPIRASLAFLKSEVAQAEAARIFTIEDLAAINEEGLQRMGIGARALKDKATQLLASKGDNHMAESLAAAHVQIEALNARINDLIASGATEKRPVGRPRSTQGT